MGMKNVLEADDRDGFIIMYMYLNATKLLIKNG